MTLWSVVTIKAIQEFKYDQFLQFQQEDKKLDYNIGRQQTTFLDAAILFDIFANGTILSHYQWQVLD
jgi:hypothetical protein